MEIDDLVTVRPRSICSLEEVDGILKQIDIYALDKEAGVVLLQNPHLGGTYLVRTKKEYEAYRPQEGRREFYAKFWPRSYFENLRERFIQ
ncbi:MAG: hypothetical protein Q8R18_04645 [bacterium]|nr:hypothetical protein [bacterium]